MNVCPRVGASNLDYRSQKWRSSTNNLVQVVVILTNPMSSFVLMRWPPCWVSPGTLLLIRELQYLAFEEIEKSAAPNHTASAIAVVGSEEDELALERACGPAPDKLHLSSLQAGAVSKSMPNLKVSSRKVLRTHHMLVRILLERDVFQGAHVDDRLPDGIQRMEIPI